MRIVINEMPQILRIELIARESNKKAITLYESLSFEVKWKFKIEYVLPPEKPKMTFQWNGQEIRNL